MPKWMTNADTLMQVMLFGSFIILFIVQLKMMSVLRSHLSLIMFYGKQIEEIRKMLAGGGAKRLPEIAHDESGLYEVLRD